MKNTTFRSIFTAFLFLGSAIAFSQDKKYPEPDLPDKLYYFDQTNNTAAEMEYGSIEETQRSKGYRGSETLLEAAKEKSVVRIKNSEKICFLVKARTEEGGDLNSVYSLLKLTPNPKTKKREIITGTQGAWSNNSNSTLTKIHFSAKKVFEQKDKFDNIVLIIRLVTVSNLEPGEYVFIDNGTHGSFFGVD